MTHVLPICDAPPPPTTVVRLVAQLPIDEPERTTPVERTRTPHDTGIVVLYDGDAVHDPVLDDHHTPVPAPQLI